MGGIRNMNVGASLWALIIAGGYLLSFEQSRQALGDEVFRQLFSAMTYGAIQLSLSVVVAVFALLAIWKVQMFWGVIVTVIAKMPLWLFMISQAGGVGPSGFQIFLRTAMVAGISYMFLAWDKGMKARRQDEARVEEFGLND